MLVKVCRKVIGLIVSRAKLDSTTAAKVGRLRSISLNLHSNVLERVDVLLGELAPSLLLALRHRHWSSSSLRIWGRVGFLCSSHTPRSAWMERIFRMGTKSLQRRIREKMKNDDNFFIFLWILKKYLIEKFYNFWQISIFFWQFWQLQRQSWRLVTFETLILRMANQNSWQSLLPDN